LFFKNIRYFSRLITEKICANYSWNLWTADFEWNIIQIPKARGNICCDLMRKVNLRQGLTRVYRNYLSYIPWRQTYEDRNKSEGTITQISNFCYLRHLTWNEEKDID
jgi:hypothetical protein